LKGVNWRVGGITFWYNFFIMLKILKITFRGFLAVALLAGVPATSVAEGLSFGDDCIKVGKECIDPSAFMESKEGKREMLAVEGRINLLGIGWGVRQDFREAERKLREAAEQGHTDSQYLLGKMYLLGLGVPQDLQEANSWLHLAAKKGHPEANFDLGEMYLFGRGVSQDYDKAIPRLSNARRLGDEEAWLWEGGETKTIFGHKFFGEGLEEIFAQEYAEAESFLDKISRWFRGEKKKNLAEEIRKERKARLDQLKEAAAQGDAEAQLALGEIYLLGGWDHPQEYLEANHWFQKSAKQGNAKAQFLLGKMYYLGLGFSQDPKEAAGWFLEAAKQGYIDAQYYLGEMLSYGQGVSKNHKQAKYWLQEAAEKGSAKSQYSLALLYILGNNKDLKEATRWLYQAAKQGHTGAQRELASLYVIGQGVVAQDQKEAMRWLREAAKRGQADAQFALYALTLSQEHLKDKGAEKEGHEDAIRWLVKAAKNGQADAQKLLEQAGVDAQRLIEAYESLEAQEKG